MTETYIYTCKFKDPDHDLMKKLNQICVVQTGQQLVAFVEHDLHIVFLKKTTSKGEIKLIPIGFCCVSPFSPENHFKNDLEYKGDDIIVNTKGLGPLYIYNYICDYKYRKYKPSVELMNFLKKFDRDMNLDIDVKNDRARNFFTRNGFQQVGVYSNTKNGKLHSYNSFSYYIKLDNPAVSS